MEIPLKQGIGKAAGPVVKEGARVKAGDLIADLEPGTMGARAHASIAGTVEKITPEAITIAAS